jgi:dolichyl-phosphate-mannose-protein mannosyltransferase
MKRGQTPFLRWGIPLAALAFFAAMVTGYGVFRDELYYLACARHLDWGYVDHPPMVAAIAAIFGPSWVALRLVSAVAFAATIVLAGDTAKAFGGGTFARIAAQLLVATTPVYLSLFSIYSMNALVVLVWAALLRVAIALLAGAESWQWVLFGILAGLGFQNKIDVGLLGAGVVAGLLVAGPREVFRRRQLWIGGAVALAIFLPHVIWQIAHGFPTAEFVRRAQEHKITGLSPLGFLGAQVMMIGPVGCAFAVAGLARILVNRTFRALGVAAVVVTAVLAFGVSKPYYLSPLFTLLLPAGAVAVEAWTSGRFRRPARVAAIALILATLLAAPLAKPLLPVDTYVRYAAALGIEAGSDENHEMGRLPQFFADMHGWREMAESVAKVSASLPPNDRALACVYGQNYGEAAAIDYFGPALSLPPAISGHNSYWMWGPGACNGEVLLIIGGDRDDHLEEFASVEAGGVHRSDLAMPYENGLTIWVARGLKVPLKDAWASTRHYD